MKGYKLPTKQLKTKESGVFAKIHGIVRPDGTVTLNGQLIDENGIRLDLDIDGRKTARNAEEIEIATKSLINRLLKKYQMALSEATCSTTVEKDASVFTSAYRSLLEDEKRELVLDGWKAPRTIRQGMSYFESFLRILDSYSAYESISDPIIRKRIEEELKKKTTESKRFRKNDASAERRINMHLRNLNEQYSLLREKAQKHGYSLPELSFNVIVERGITIDNEQIKALSGKLYVQPVAGLRTCTQEGFSCLPVWQQHPCSTEALSCLGFSQQQYP